MSLLPVVDERPAVPVAPRSVLPAASPVFVAGCMVVVAGSLAMLLYLRAGLALAEAAWIGLAVLLVMVLAEFFSARTRERSAVERELQAIARLSAAVRGDVETLGERVADIEATLTIRIEDMIEERLELVRADLAAFDARLDGLYEATAARPHSEVRSPAPHAVPPPPQSGGDDPDSPFAGMDDAEAAAIIAKALEEHGPDIHLQSIVTLPQRRVRFYEALTRLRSDDLGTLMPRHFLPPAERTGIVAVIDNAVLFRSVQILRKMGRKNRDAGIFCNISARSLSDVEFFRQFVEFMGDNRNLAGSIVFEFAQAAFNDLGPVELANLDALAELDFSFSIDNVTRLELDGQALAARGVRYVKVDAGLLVAPPPGAAGDIHAADLAAFLARHGIELIATRVETEAEVVDVLDYDVKLAQGNLFSLPRPVRADLTPQRAAAAR